MEEKKAEPLNVEEEEETKAEKKSLPALLRFVSGNRGFHPYPPAISFKAPLASFLSFSAPLLKNNDINRKPKNL